MLDFLKKHILPYLIFVIYRLYTSTVRYKEDPMPVDEPGIFAHFHQDELVLIALRRNTKMCVMTSTSTDGQMMTRCLQLMGYHCVRGSASRGGAKALIELIHFLNKNSLNAVMAVDGPRGPIYKVKMGVIILAKRTGMPIIPVRTKPLTAFCFSKSWNKALLPKLFTKVDVHFGEVIRVPKNAEGDELEKYRVQLEEELLKLDTYTPLNSHS